MTSTSVLSNIFWKHDVSILEQIVRETKGKYEITILVAQAYCSKQFFKYLYINQEPLFLTKILVFF